MYGGSQWCVCVHASACPKDWLTDAYEKQDIWPGLDLLQEWTSLWTTESGQFPKRLKDLTSKHSCLGEGFLSFPVCSTTMGDAVCRLEIDTPLRPSSQLFLYSQEPSHLSQVEPAVVTEATCL